MVSKSLTLLLLLLFVTTGCLNTLKTRKDLNGSGAPVTKAQKAAQEEQNIENINQDFRKLYGRVEVVENKMAGLTENQEINGLKLQVAQLETKLALIEETVAKLNTNYKKGTYSKPVKRKGPYEKGSDYYNQGKWEDAILAFEEYRKKNPKGKSYSTATYRIGISFKKLGMKSDAKAFFKECVNKFPKSKSAKRAKSELKTI